MNRVEVEVQSRDVKGPWTHLFNADLVIKDRDTAFRINSFFQISEGVIVISMVLPSIDSVFDILKEHSRCGNFSGAHIEVQRLE